MVEVIHKRSGSRPAKGFVDLTKTEYIRPSQKYATTKEATYRNRVWNHQKPKWLCYRCKVLMWHWDCPEYTAIDTPKNAAMICTIKEDGVQKDVIMCLACYENPARRYGKAVILGVEQPEWVTSDKAEEAANVGEDINREIDKQYQHQN
jgi:hypothetical protein